MPATGALEIPLLRAWPAPTPYLPAALLVPGKPTKFLSAAHRPTPSMPTATNGCGRPAIQTTVAAQ